MSRVNVDEIEVGDLVANYCSIMDKTDLGVVTKVVGEKVYAIWSCFMATQSESQVNYKELEGHWKVINFEEENKMDELKVYTGKETIEALLEGKVLKRQDTKGEYRFNNGELQFYTNGKFCKIDTSFTDMYNVKFTEVVTPQVGDWVRVNGEKGTHTGRITRVDDTYMWAKWSNYPEKNTALYLYHDWEILSPEQVSEYKREQAFVKVGRKLNEFHSGDIVYIDSLAVVATVITKQSNVNTEIKLHGINEKGKGYTARAHQLTPISFIEQQVDLS